MTSLQTKPVDPAALDEVVGRFVPAVSDLVRRITGGGARAVRLGPSHARVSGDLLFPDGVGRGTVVVGVFRYRGDLRVDLAIEHNRVFAGRGGEPSENRCYLNDYVASVTLSRQEAELPVEFVRKVVSGVGAARTAVERYRRRSGWFLAEITTARPVFTPQPAAVALPLPPDLSTER
ncbi:MAG TPA: hypothetical protein VD707_02825 [Gemmatimonadales bacterium]|nr:hypothetical protein [Gemmatimonadales bacterium]